MGTTDTDYEQFEQVELPDEQTADAVASVISEQFHDPTVTAVLAMFEDDAVEFDASDIGSISVVDGRLHGMIRETPPVDTIEEVRVRSKPWLTDRMDELVSVEGGDTLRLNYVSRFGGEVSKDITVEEAQIDGERPPYGYDGLDADVDGEAVHVDIAAVFGYKEDADYSVMVQSNGGVNVLMNDTRIVEPGTVPSFEVISD